MQTSAPPSLTAPVTQPVATGISASPRWILILVLIVVALSAAVRVVDLDRFGGHVFDEYYYVHDANVILDGDLGPSGADSWKPGAARSAAHPHLGTLAIAAGIAAFGNDPWGWRLPSALAGTAVIALVFPLARRMKLPPVWALGALVLAAADTMLIVESRLGVLDIFVTLWGVVAVYCALRWVQDGWSPWWMAACGAALGCAVATKWSGALAVLAVLAVVALHWRSEGRPALSRLMSRTAVLLVLLPLAIYALSYAAYFADGHTVGEWVRLQRHMLTFNWGVQGNRSFASAAATWPFDVHPIWYRWLLNDVGTVGLLAIGNPLLWWGGAVAFIGLGVQALTRRRVDLALGPLLVAAFYVPWLFTSRQSYIYYMAPVVPFVAGLVATALWRVTGSEGVRHARGTVAAFLLGLLVTACGFWVLGAAESTLGWVRDAAGWVGVAAVAALVVAGAALALRVWGRGRVRETLVGIYVGAVAGVPVALLPFLLGFPVAFEYYDRLMIFTTWR